MTTWTTNGTDFANFLLVSQIDPEGIRRRLRQARHETGLTQQEVADALEIHKRTIENYENSRVPEFRMLNRLADVLNVSVAWLLHGDAMQPTEDVELRSEIAALREAQQDLVRRFDELADLLRDARSQG
jgi:transcriptional regulator with XRE-family HTH domain